MYDEPYLETCCRSALHRLRLCAVAGRPADTRDSGCLHRLARMGLARVRADGRYEAAVTADAPEAAVTADASPSKRLA
jgi:hypothetical protein